MHKSSTIVWSIPLEQMLRRFLKKNILIQDVGAGLIKMSYLGQCGSRFNRAATACIAAFPSAMPFGSIWWLRATSGCLPCQVICLAPPRSVSASISFVPFHGNSKSPQHLAIGCYVLGYGGESSSGIGWLMRSGNGTIRESNGVRLPLLSGPLSIVIWIRLVSACSCSAMASHVASLVSPMQSRVLSLQRHFI
jgi:hypothetical protein